MINKGDLESININMQRSELITSGPSKASVVAPIDSKIFKLKKSATTVEEQIPASQKELTIDDLKIFREQTAEFGESAKTLAQFLLSYRENMP